MRKLLSYLKNYRQECFLGPLFKLFEATFELIIPLLVAAIIDTGIKTNNVPYIIKTSVIMVLLAVIGFICAIIAQYFAAKASCGLAKDIKHSLFSHIQEFSYTDLDKLGTSTIITRLTSDVNQVQTGVNLAIRLLLRSPFIVFGAAIMAFIVDSKSAITFVVAIPVLAIIVFAIILGCIPLYKKVQGKIDTILLRTRENLNGVRVLRAFRLEEKEVDDFKAENKELAKSQVFVGKISALLNPITYVIINVAIIVLIYIGAIQVNVGIITQGTVIALYNYMSQILIELIKLANLIVTLTKTVACGNRIEEMLETESSESKHGDKKISYSPNAVAFNKVSFKYDGAAENALNNISFKAPKGSTIGIIGATGSGKSTLVNLIADYYRPQKGTICINGTNVSNWDKKTLYNQIAVVPQKAVLFKGTIKSNLLFGNEGATDEDIKTALTLSQSNDIIEAKENGIDSVVEQGGKNFSGGQKQRLTIARALVKKPKILILDDSASALDLATDANLRLALKDLPDKPTVFIVSQRTSSVMYSDLILVLDDGELVGQGTHDELMKSCDVYREIYTSQYSSGEEVHDNGKARNKKKH